MQGNQVGCFACFAVWLILEHIKHICLISKAFQVEDSKDKSSDLCSEETTSNFNVMGNVLKFVESTGEMIVSSGLNTLESLGKKTMDVLQDGDPGLKKKRALFSKEPDRPTLSQVLTVYIP